MKNILLETYSIKIMSVSNKAVYAFLGLIVPQLRADQAVAQT